MGLVVTSVHVENFRSYESFQLELDEGLTILVGPNAVGKTNLLEAIRLLTAGESFRRPRWNEVVRWGAEKSFLALEAGGDGRSLSVELDVTAEGKREFRINGKVRRRIVDFAGVLPSVVFTPDDLLLVKESADRRRGALDDLGGELSPSYTSLRMEYERALRQRNTMLRDEAGEGPVFEAWTDRLVDLGVSLVEARKRLFGRLGEAMAEAYQGISRKERLEVRYQPSWERDGILGDEETAEMMRRHLVEKSREEAARRTSLSGPHRDDVLFTLDGRDARVFASQGQQRTIALAWKVGEVRVVEDVSGQQPLLLLDDVMSELDEIRRHALADFVGRTTQTIVTTTNLGYFEESLVGKAKVVRLS